MAEGECGLLSEGRVVNHSSIGDGHQIAKDLKIDRSLQGPRAAVAEGKLHYAVVGTAKDISQQNCLEAARFVRWRVQRKRGSAGPARSGKAGVVVDRIAIQIRIVAKELLPEIF